MGENVHVGNIDIEFNRCRKQVTATNIAKTMRTFRVNCRAIEQTVRG
jgi:hypothetical protein